MSYIKGVPPLHLRNPRMSDMGLQPLIESVVNKGMITSIDSADLDNGALQLAKNIVIRDDRTKRRAGSSLLDTPKPNSESVIRIAFIKSQDGSPYTLRMTPSSIHVRGVDSWRSISITPALAGGIKDRFITANILNKFIFSNNGANPIQLVDFTTNTCKPLGNATNYRYVLGFYNRAVGLARKDINEVEVGWSADGLATEWDPTVNQTAGNSPLIESPADLSDFIKGGVALTNSMFILREKSVWLATKQPIATNPFYFYSAYPGIGGDCSYSIQLVVGGICWVDTRTHEVYFYQPGGAPIPIGTTNKKKIFADITEPLDVFSSFSSKPNEYTIYVPVANNVTRAWTFSFVTKTWVQNEFENVTAAENVEVAIASVTIDDLVGSIDDLAGTIDSLSPTSSVSIPFSYGRSDGEIAVEDETVDSDAPNKPYTTTLISKSFVLPSVNENIGKLYIEYRITRPSILVLYYSKDDGLTWIEAKLVLGTITNKPIMLVFKQLIHARRFSWKLEAHSGDVEIMSYGIFTYPAGESAPKE